MEQCEREGKKKWSFSDLRIFNLSITMNTSARIVEMEGLGREVMIM